MGVLDPQSTCGSAPPLPLTFQWLHNLQFLGEVGEGAEGEAGGSSELRVARVAGASGDDAALGGEEATGARPISQPPEFAFAFGLEEGALLGVVALLPHRQPLHRRLQVLLARGCPGVLAAPLGPAGGHSVRVPGAAGPAQAPQPVLGPSQTLPSLPKAVSCSAVTSRSHWSSRRPTCAHPAPTPALTGHPPSRSRWCGGCWSPQSGQQTTAWSLERGGETQSKTWLWLPVSLLSPSRRRAGSSCGWEEGQGEPEPVPRHSPSHG